MRTRCGRAWTTLVICLLIWPASAWAGKRGQSSPEDRAKVVKLTRQLEPIPWAMGLSRHDSGSSRGSRR